MDGYDASTYGDRIAEVYDAWYGDRMDPSATVEFLAGLAGRGPALELGIGTGRIALPLAQRGVAVQGIDASRAMVAKLRDKPGGDQIPVVIGDFTDTRLEERFSLVYIPFTTFFAVDSQEAQVRCLRNVANHLTSDGRFVLDAFVPDVERFSHGQSTSTLETGVDYAILNAERHEPVAQVIEGQHIFISQSGVTPYPFRLRYCWPSELDVMAQLAGLTLEDRFAWYDRSPFDARSTRHVSVYSLGTS